MANAMISVLFGFVVVTTPTFSARILGLVPTPSFSHQIVFRPLWRELSLRGHNVVVLTTDPMKDPTLTNLTEIDASSSYKQWNEMNFNELSEKGFIRGMDKIVSFFNDVMEEQMQLPEVQNLLKNETEHFDVVMLEFPILAPFAERFDCPIILMSSQDLPSLMYQALGNPSHPVLNPDIMLGFPDKLNFFQRLASSLFTVSMKFIYKYVIMPFLDTLIKKHFGNDYSPLEEILKRTSLMLVNTNVVFEPPRPLLPHIIQIGGGIHMTQAKPLPKKTIKDNKQFTKETEKLNSQNWHQLQSELLQAAENTAPRTRKRTHAWWTDGCYQLIQLRQQAWQN
ncbi:hypothetical protein ILUMI_03653 [Ignelater luminosus]|uniref:Uncharacterized protein n=1 Tax=Ignelater luminosus TaxID=2038154 RepID=A0A8K0DLC7_IGNLU|nr:hypothetical protein ILUMI_03653 [Ignelater luminosus]